MNKILIVFFILSGAIFTTMAADTAKFVIKGTVDPDIKASAVAIFIADNAQGSIPDVPTAKVNVEEGKFTYETLLDDIKPGCLRVILTNGEMYKTVVNLDFVPDFTLYVNLHDGYCGIANGKEYLEKVEEYCRLHHKDTAKGKAYIKLTAEGAKMETEKGETFIKASGISIDDDNSRLAGILDSHVTNDVKERYVRAEIRKEVLKSKLEQYKEMLKYIDGKLETCRDYNERVRLFHQRDETLNSMRIAIDDFEKDND